MSAARAELVAGLERLERLQRLERRRGQPATDVSKQAAVGRIVLGTNSMPQNDPIYAEFRAWLAGELRAGRQPRYKIDERAEQALVRM